MNLKRLIKSGLFACCLFLSGSVLAQSKTISGSVTDSKKGAPLAGVTVEVKGERAATTTDEKGGFVISLSGSAHVLMISSVGYENLEVDITGKNVVSVQLVPGNTALNQVVVTGYTTQRKKDLTGSVAIVDVSSMKAQPAASVGEAL